MCMDALRKLGAGLVIAAFLWSCDAPMAPEGAPTEEAPTVEVQAAVVLPEGPSLANSVEGEIIIGEEVEENDGETLPEGGGDPLNPATLPPIVHVNAPTSVEAGTGIKFDVEVHSFAPGGATYLAYVVPNYVGPKEAGFYTGYAWQGTVASTTTNFTAPKKGAQLGTTLIWALITNANGKRWDAKTVQVLPRRPRFPSGADFLPPTMVAGTTSERDLLLEKPAQPSASDYVLPLTVDFGDGRTQSYDWDIVEAWGAGYKTIPMMWERPGTYSVTFKVAATNAPAYSSTHTESITILPNPKWPNITNFVSPDQVVPGRTYEISFNPGGPEYPGELFEVRTYRENGSSSLSYAHPGETSYLFKNWPDVPGQAWLTTIVSGTVDGILRADTLRWSVVVASDPIVVGSFVGPEDVSFGEEASFSFRADGGTGPYTATIFYGDGSEPTVLEIARGATVNRTRTWAESGLWDLNIVVANGFTADTLTEEVAIYRPRPTIDDVSIPETMLVGEEGLLSFVPNDTRVVDRLVYQLLMRENGGPYQTLTQDANQGEPIQLPLAPDHSSVFEIKIAVFTFLNELGIGSDTVSHTLTVVDLPCTAGSYRDGPECVDAPAGFHVPDDGALEAVPCPIGTYQDQEGQTSCIDAPAGSFVSGVGQAQAELCAPGSYSDVTGASACTPAPPGRFVAGAGATSAEDCPVGTFQAISGQTGCDPAPVGSYVDVTGAAQATPCAPGTYQPVAGSTGCLDAPAGSFVSISGAAAATSCVVGTFQPATGSASCEPAPLGSFVSGVGQVQAELCAPGFYSDHAGAVACTPAPAGQFVAGAGAASAADCTVGTFQALSGQTGCDPAPVGSYVDVTGAAQATPCAPGTYQPVAGSTGCLDAPAGSFVSISGAAAATSCVVGTFQASTGQTFCDQAPIGAYVDVIGASSATPCPLGSSTLGTGSTTADACIPLGVILLGDVEQAVADGTLVPTGNGNAGEQQMSGWISDLDRSVAFLEGPQKQAGCVGVRNALAKADGNGSPKDQVTGPARAAIAAALQRILDENGCGG